MVGPPRIMFREDLTPEHWHGFIDRSIWLRLSRLESSGVGLGEAAAQRLEELRRIYPQWQPAPDESDEFSFWQTSSSDPDYDIGISPAPQKRGELVGWLKQYGDDPMLGNSDWPHICRKHPLNSLYALYDLALENEYPFLAWSEALHIFGKNNSQKLLLHINNVIKKLSDNGLQKIVPYIAGWLYSITGSSGDCEKGILLGLSKRILQLPCKSDSDETQGIDERDPVNAAINHYIGKTTEAIVKICFKSKLYDDDRLPDDIEPLFTKICCPENKEFRYGRVILALQLIPLFRVDPHWTEKYLLPFFDWSSDVQEALSVWAGFLHSPRLFVPLLQALKVPFLNTVQHYSKLGSHKASFVAFLTYKAVTGVEGFTSGEFKKVFEQLEQSALETAAWALVQAPQGTGEQKANYWQNRIKPFWQQIWPKRDCIRSERISESLARVCISVDSSFPDALATVKYWLQPIALPDSILSGLSKNGLCSKFPQESLILLDAVLDEQSHVSNKLQQCLDAIIEADNSLKDGNLYTKLNNYKLY